MPAICRAGIDVHECGSVDTEGSPNVFVNGYSVHRLGDGQSHGGVQGEGSATVFVNGVGVARKGDFTIGEPPPPVQHGDHAEATGSPDVFADENP